MRKALKVKKKKKKEAVKRAIHNNRKPKFPTKVYNICGKCGRVRSYMRRFGICRICFRELAREGKIMGVRKSSW